MKVKLIHGTSVALLGTFFGAMLVIAAALMRYWGSLPPEAYRSSFQAIGPYLGAVMVPLMAVSIALPGISLWVSRGNRLPWIIAFGSVFMIIPLYGVVHGPLNDLLLGSSVLSTELVASLRGKWFFWHWVRTLLGLVALAASVKGFETSSRVSFR